MHFAAFGAFAQLGLFVEGVVDRRQVVDDAFQIDLGAVDQRLTVEAIPFDRVQRALGAPADPQFRTLAYARRSDEWQRLLDLPASPGPAIEPPVTQSYPFVVPAEEPPDAVPTAAMAAGAPPFASAA